MVKPTPKEFTAPKKQPGRTDTAGVFIKVLGCDLNTGEIAQRVREGLDIHVIDRLAEVLDVPKSKLLDVTHISSASQSRGSRKRMKPGPRLNTDESGRIYRVTNVLAAATQLFEGDARAASRWLQAPSKALGGVPPFDFLDTEAGADAVRELIGRLEQGVTS